MPALQRARGWACKKKAGTKQADQAAAREAAAAARVLYVTAVGTASFRCFLRAAEPRPDVTFELL